MKIIEYEEKYLEDVRNLLVELEEYFKNCGCKYVIVDVFAYNDNGINFYSKSCYHSRMHTMIKEIK